MGALFLSLAGSNDRNTRCGQLESKLRDAGGMFQRQNHQEQDDADKAVFYHMF